MSVSKTTVPIDALAEIRRLAPAGSHVVFVSGNFNILHPGHVRLLRFAKECGDFLVVGVLADETSGEAALLGESLRLEGVQTNSWVGFAFILRQPPEDFIRVLKPAVVVKGKEHEEHNNPEYAAVSEYGGRLLFGSGDSVFSSLDLLRRELQAPHPSRILLPDDFPIRHGFTRQDLRALVKRFSEVRVAVVGDLIVDEYIDCDPLGMSQEDPTIVVTPIYRQYFVGGAGIVAAHAAMLGADVDYFSVAGRDEPKRVAEVQMQEHGVRFHLLEDDSRPTTLKQRFRAQGKTLLRVSHLRQHALDADIQEVLIEALRAVLDEADVLIFSDYNYGCLPQPLVDAVTRLGHDRGVVMVADSQSSSQVGDVSRFRGMTMLTPTEREARVSTHNHDDGLVVLAESLRRRSQARNILLKLGAEGLLVHSALSRDNQWLTDQLPSFAVAARDTAGAGDSLLAASSLALALGAPLWQAAYLGSLAAALQVDRLGNPPIRAAELLAELHDR